MHIFLCVNDVMTSGFKSSHNSSFFKVSLCISVCCTDSWYVMLRWLPWFYKNHTDSQKRLCCSWQSAVQGTFHMTAILFWVTTLLSCVLLHPKYFPYFCLARCQALVQLCPPLVRSANIAAFTLWYKLSRFVITENQLSALWMGQYCLNWDGGVVLLLKVVMINQL